MASCVFLSASRSRWKQLTALKTNETLFEAFLFEVSLAVSLFLPLLYFHFQLREKLELCAVMDSEIKGSRIHGLVFHLTAVNAGCDFMQTQFKCAHGLLAFSLSQNSLQLENFKVSSCELCKLCKLFFSFTENWTLLPLMTYSQTDTKAFSCMIL